MRNSASDHPATWKFDFPIFHPADAAAWRAWLQEHHRTTRGVWVLSWRKATGRPAVAYERLVEEALCFGWIDSTSAAKPETKASRVAKIVSDAEHGRRAVG